MKNQTKLLHIKPFLFALSIILLLTSAIPALAQIQLYVATTGSSGNTGTTLGSPKATIAQAEGLMTNPGHYQVNVAPGIYNGAILTTKSGNSAAQRITYISTVRATGGGTGAIIKAPAGGDAVWRNTGNYVTIDGFEIDGTYTAGTRPRLGIHMGGGTSSPLVLTTTRTVQNCLVHDVFTNANGNSGGGAGILLDGGWGINMDALNNKVYRCGPQDINPSTGLPYTGGNWYQGIYHSASGGSIKNNVVYLVSGAGIHGWHSDRNLEIINNTSVKNDIGIVWGGGGQYAPYIGVSAVNIDIRNNIFAHNKSWGILENGSNNTTTDPHDIRYNISYQNGTPSTSAKNMNVAWSAQSNNLYSNAAGENPNFVNLAGNDFHLTAASTAAINGGISTAAPTNDYDNLVPRTGNPDIGAYEYVASCGSTAISGTPNNLVLTPVSSKQINLTWSDPVTNETKYYVERATSSGGPWTQFELKAGSGNYASTGLTASTTYWYRVRAWNCHSSSVTSALSAATTGTCSPTSLPAAPTSLALTVISGTQINLAWTDNATNETAYKIERATASGGPFVEIASSFSFSGSGTYASTGLNPSTTYWFRVRAYNCFSTGFSSYSNTPSATTNSSLMSGGNLSSTAPLPKDSNTGGTTDTAVHEPNKKVSLYPNPFNAVLNLKIADDVILNKAVLKIVDWNGKEVRTVPISNYHTSIFKDRLESGIYFYILTNNGQAIDKGRLVVQ